MLEGKIYEAKWRNKLSSNPIVQCSENSGTPNVFVEIGGCYLRNLNEKY